MQVEVGEIDNQMRLESGEIENSGDNSGKIDNEPEPVQGIQDTWSGRWSVIVDYKTDSEPDDFDEGGNFDERGKTDSYSEFHWKETGMRNGLEIDELVNEDFQRIIANFGKFSLHYRFKKP